MRVPHIDYKNATGLVDKFVGLGREVVGIAFDNDDLTDAGRTQQVRGTERLEAIREQAKAEAHKAKAQAHEKRERTVQQSKAS